MQLHEKVATTSQIPQNQIIFERIVIANSFTKQNALTYEIELEKKHIGIFY